MGTQKNCFNATVLLSIQNICLKLWVRKYLQFYDENFCLSKPLHITSTVGLNIYYKIFQQEKYNVNIHPGNI